MTATEVDNLWKKLPIERDGTLNFIELVKICFSKADKAAPNGEQDKTEHGVLSRVLQNYARTHVRDSLDKFLEEDEDQQYLEEVTMETTLDEKPADQDINMNNKPLSTSAKIEDIILKIKNEVRSNFTQLQDDLRQACKDNNSTIDTAVFSEILLKYCKSLSNAECNKLCHRFDKGHKGSIRCKEFMKVFVPTMPEGTDPIASRCHSRHDRSKTYPVMDGVSTDTLSVVMYKMKNKMICEWKALRRAMKRCDHYDNGMISIADFKTNLREFGFDLSDEDFFHILSEFDINMDGRISYVAFMKQAVL